jgi:hypothetical protein
MIPPTTITEWQEQLDKRHALTDAAKRFGDLRMVQLQRMMLELARSLPSEMDYCPEGTEDE